MRPKTEIETFVSNWGAKNVRSVSGLANLTGEVDRLAGHLTCDARTLGIGGGEINMAVGDFDDYLTQQCRHHQPLQGFDLTGGFWSTMSGSGKRRPLQLQ